MILADAYSAGAEGLQFEGIARRAAVRAAVAAIAARQPVYEGHTWVSDYVLAGLRERAALPLQIRNGEVWHWQGDGHDFPESLVCPVIMSAETLRALLAARQPVSEADAYQQGFRDGQDRTCTVVASQPVASNQPSGNSGELDVDAARQPVGEPVAWVNPGQLEEFRNGTSSFGARIPARIEKGGLFDMPLYTAPPAQAVDLGPSFQAGVAEWMGQCFLPSLYSNMTERGDRLLEEVLELLQAHGYDRARVPTLVDYVFGRPVGEPAQEVGGVMVTLAGYCWVGGIDMHAAGDAELARINQPDVMAKIRAKQEAKNALHFDTPLPGDPAATDAWPREGDLVRYGDGASALAIRLEPHAGGWHGYQCCGGYTFFTKAHKPSRADMETWLDCAKYRDERTETADNRVAHEMYLVDSEAAGNG